LSSFGLAHRDDMLSVLIFFEQAMQEYLPTTRLASLVGPFFTSRLLCVGDQYQHLEYRPLVNARAHLLRTRAGSTSALPTPIQNVELREQWSKFLTYAAYRSGSLATLPNADLLAAAYYLLLQDRTDEAKKMYARIDFDKKMEVKGEDKGTKDKDPKDLTDDVSSSTSTATGKRQEEEGKGQQGLGQSELQLQYDYFGAYLDMINPGSASSAAAIALKYLKHPVPKKRKLFEEIVQHLGPTAPTGSADGESEQETKKHKKATPGGGSDNGDDRDRDAQMHDLASKAPALDLKMQGDRMEISYQNIAKCTINFYPVDVESLFSSEPFKNLQASSASLVVAPIFSLAVDLPADKRSTLIDVPDRFRNTNAYVEAAGHI
jgi:hypothetical protein